MFRTPVTKIINNCKRHYTKALNIANILRTNQNTGDVVQIKGWVKSIRKMKDNVFFDVSDGSCLNNLQVILTQTMKPKDLTTGCSVIATGSLNLAPRGHLELQASDVQVLGKCIIVDGYPFSPKKTYSAEYLRQHLHLRPRTKTFSALLRLRNAVNFAMHEYLHSEGYVNIQTPILTSNDCEGAGELFMVQPDNKNLLKDMVKEGVPTDEAFFDTKAFLTVSGQLHLEAAAHSFNKVYSLGPTFRAENSRSRLHLSEFYMLEAEIAFVDKIEDICNAMEKLIKSVTLNVLNKNAEDLQYCQSDNKPNLSWTEKKFHLVTYQEAVSILNRYSTYFTTPLSATEGFTKEHEIVLTRHFDDVPAFIINWPKAMKPFYMKECEDDPASKVAALDLLGPNVGEVAGGSLRENDYEKLKARLPKDRRLDWYLELRKFGSVPTGGFGLGFERYLQLITGIGNIKDTIPFPRWPHNCSL